MSKDTEERPNLNAGFVIHEVARLLRRDFDRRAKDLGLTQVQWRAISYLARNEGLNQAALADQLEVQPITLARMIDRLAAAGWVERRPDPDDRRAQRLFLTEASAPLLERMRALAAETLDTAFTGLSDQTRKELVEGLCVMKNNLSEALPRNGASPKESHD